MRAKIFGKTVTENQSWVSVLVLVLFSVLVVTTELRVRGHLVVRVGGKGGTVKWGYCKVESALRPFKTRFWWVESDIAAKEDLLVDLSTTALFCFCILRDVQRSSLTPAT